MVATESVSGASIAWDGIGEAVGSQESSPGHDLMLLSGDRHVMYTAAIVRPESDWEIEPYDRTVWHTPESRTAGQCRRQGLPVLGLLLATLAWAGSFTWAKAAGDGVNQAAGLASGALLGPILLLAWRFTAAGIFWLILIPGARRHWSWASVGTICRDWEGCSGPDKRYRCWVWIAPAKR